MDGDDGEELFGVGGLTVGILNWGTGVVKRRCRKCRDLTVHESGFSTSAVLTRMQIKVLNFEYANNFTCMDCGSSHTEIPFRSFSSISVPLVELKVD